MRKGLYFTFDALVAVTVTFFVFFLIMHGTPQTAERVSLDTAQYTDANTGAEDVMQVMTQQTFFDAFSASYRQDVYDDTVVEKIEDENKTVENVIGVLWAVDDKDAGKPSNYTYAKNISRDFTENMLPDTLEYRVQVAESGETTVLFNTSNTTDEASFITQSSRVISGFEQGRATKGFIARAEAEKGEKNATEVFQIPMQGSSHGSPNAFTSTCKFKPDMESHENITDATLYLGVHGGTANINGNTDVVFNNDDLDTGSPMYQADTGTSPDTGVAFFEWDVTDEMQDNAWNNDNNGWHILDVTVNVQSSWHGYINPGSRLVVEYKDAAEFRTSNEINRTQHFCDVVSDDHNNHNGGAWHIMPFHIPQDATVRDVTLTLNGTGVDDIADKDDVQVYLNGDVVEKGDLQDADGDVFETFNVTENVSKGETNVLSMYLNSYINGSNVEGEADADDYFWGSGTGSVTNLRSDPQNAANSSKLHVQYDKSGGGLVFGKLRLTKLENISGGMTESKEHDIEFEDNITVRNSFLHLMQLDSYVVNVTADDQSPPQHRAFSSPERHATPTEIYVNPDFFDLDVTNFVNVTETDCRSSGNCSILPESQFEKDVLIPSLVPYGETFENRSAAEDDAVNRLEDKLGDALNMTDISNKSLSIPEIPSLFGPATIQLEVWRLQ